MSRPGAEKGPPGGAAGRFRSVDVHDAGAQRSDPKDGDPAAVPQGDVVRIRNRVRGGPTR